MLLIKTRYLQSLSSIFYIKGNYAEALKHAEAAERICADDKQFTYDTIQDVVKNHVEIKKLIIKC